MVPPKIGETIWESLFRKVCASAPAAQDLT